MVKIPRNIGVSWRDLEGDRLLPSNETEEKVNYTFQSSQETRKHPRSVHFGNEVLIHERIHGTKETPFLKSDQFQFGTRISCLLFISSLFVVVAPNGKPWPSGTWVIITTLMVSWFPSMDAASVIEKSIQRCTGTVFGGLLGLFLGFLCQSIEGYTTRVICLELCFTACVFLVCYTSLTFQLSRKQRIINRYSYATALSLLTFTIAIFPFVEPEAEKPWKKAVARVVNVAIGSIIGTTGSVLLLPRSTTTLLRNRIKSQCQLAGEAAEAVLMESANVFSGDMPPVSFSEELRGNKDNRKLRQSILIKSFRRINQEIISEGNDIALEKYELALKEWRVTKSLFSILSFDPFHYFMECKHDFKSTCAVALGRSLRVQTTVVLMDGIVRNDPPHNFSDDLIGTFGEIGTLIRKMLHVAVDDSDTSDAAKDLLDERISTIRSSIRKLACTVSDAEIVLVRNNETSQRCSKRKSIVYDDNDVRHALLYLQLVEHLVLRCIALRKSWDDVEEILVPNRL